MYSGMELIKRRASDLYYHAAAETTRRCGWKDLDPDTLPPFEYTPLEPDEIRLVTLLKGKRHEQLNIQITHKVIDDETDYKALSYVWGDRNNPLPILVDRERVLRVPHNLWAALKQIRQKKNDVMLWIDAICINQECRKEKSRQLPNMRWIYPQAKKVLCWLGEDDGTISEAFDALTEWAKAYDDPALCNQLVINTENYLTSRLTGASNGLDVLFQRPYWRRAWCLQEVCVDGTNPPMLLCGKHFLCWSTLYKGFLCMASSLDSCASLIGNNVGFVLPMITTCWKPPEDLHMSDLVPDAAIREAHDAHDIIFSLLGLAERRGIEYPAPDYHNTIEETCMIYTRAIIAKDQRLCILTTVDSHRSDDIVPSWSIKPGRWAKTETTDARRLDMRRSRTFRYSATMNLKPYLEEPNGPTDPILKIRGLKLDMVREILDVQLFATTNLEKAQTWKEIMKFCNKFCSERLPSDGNAAVGQQTVEAFLRTITCDDFWILSQRTRQQHFQDRLYAAYREHVRSLRTSKVAEELPCMNKSQLVNYMKTHFCFPAQRLRMKDIDGAVVKMEGHAVHNFLERRACNELRRVIHDKLAERKFVVTEKGCFGVGPAECTVADVACLFPGSTVPLILRRTGSKDEPSYLLIGDAYVHGVMYGEALEGLVNPDGTPELDKSNGWIMFKVV